MNITTHDSSPQLKPWEYVSLRMNLKYPRVTPLIITLCGTCGGMASKCPHAEANRLRRNLREILDKYDNDTITQVFKEIIEKKNVTIRK